MGEKNKNWLDIANGIFLDDLPLTNKRQAVHRPIFVLAETGCSETGTQQSLFTGK